MDTRMNLLSKEQLKFIKRLFDTRFHKTRIKSKSNVPSFPICIDLLEVNFGCKLFTIKRDIGKNS